MVYQILLTEILEGLDNFSLLEWHLNEGDAVVAGELIVELETQKTIIALHAAGPNYFRRILCEQGESRRINEPIALLSTTPDEPLPEVVSPELSTLDLEFDFDSGL